MDNDNVLYALKVRDRYYDWETQMHEKDLEHASHYEAIDQYICRDFCKLVRDGHDPQIMRIRRQKQARLADLQEALTLKLPLVVSLDVGDGNGGEIFVKYSDNDQLLLNFTSNWEDAIRFTSLSSALWVVYELGRIGTRRDDEEILEIRGVLEEASWTEEVVR